MIIDKNSKKLTTILTRGEVFEDRYLSAVMDIIKNVRDRGDEAVKEYTMKFDRHNPDESYVINVDELKSAYDSLDQKIKKSLTTAEKNIRKYHEMQMEKTWLYQKNEDITLGQKITPLDNVGIYVPGGKAVYPSSVLMNSIPADVAGVKSISMATPANNGIVKDIVLAAAYIGGVKNVYKIGGAQAIAAFTYGTNTVKKVDKIVGPGNIYVALAKKMVFGSVDIDMIAGPSEITIIADDTAKSEWVAADMLSQAEHDEMASAVLITVSQELAENVEKEIDRQLTQLPKKEIASRSLKDFGGIIKVADIQEAVALANKIAPEHLELCVSNPYEIMLQIKNAGAMFLGHFTPEAAGDYIAGPNHTLPTGGTSRFFSPLGTYDFIKRSSIISFNKNALAHYAEDIATIAGEEDLDAHRKSVKIRTEST